MSSEIAAAEIGGLIFPSSSEDSFTSILSDQACSFVADLIERFAQERDLLLGDREKAQAKINSGVLPGFSRDSKNIRHSKWTCNSIPADLLDRRVEITGPPERKTVINALNANVRCFMADFEDATSPTWDAIINGQINLRDAVNRTISYLSSEGKHYQLHPDPAVLICRVRGLHLDEKHIQLKDYEGTVPGSLVDFGLYLFHNYSTLIANQSGPYFYLPKLQSWQEAAWWSKIFCYTEDRFDLERGTIKATMLIETLPAVFQMHEMLFALREHAVALNCGRWDYIFSYIKTLHSHDDKILPDRKQVTMDKPFLDAYSRLLIKTCHQRKVLAMGGMSAFIPSKDLEVHQTICAKIRADKEREVGNGHDGSWVAHPGLAGLVKEIFDAKLGDKPNQIDELRKDDEPIGAVKLLTPPPGERTEAGMRSNIRVALQYIEAWLGGKGCVLIYGLMEDAATAEIARTSIWQWLHKGIKIDNGETVTAELFLSYLEEEYQVVSGELGNERFNNGHFIQARELLEQLITCEKLEDFFTLSAYRQI